MGRLIRNSGRIVPAEVLGAKGQAAAIVAAARAQADDMRREAQQTRDEARRLGHDQGYRQGYDAGRDAGAATLTETLAAAALDRERARVGVRTPPMQLAARLAAKMAETIVGRVLTLSPALLSELVEQALVASGARGGVVRLLVHPDDLATLRADPARGRLLARLQAGADLQIQADAAVGRHGCIVESATVRVDARLDTQLAALERALVAEADRG